MAKPLECRDDAPYDPPRTVKEAAARIGVRERTAWRLLAKGELIANRPSPGRVVIFQSEIDRFNKAHPYKACA